MKFKFYFSSVVLLLCALLLFTACSDCEHIDENNDSKCDLCEDNMHVHQVKPAVEENRTEATCTTDGQYDSVIYCETCNSEISRETKTLKALGHAPKDAVEENRTEATCTTDGQYDSVIYCETCNSEISRETKTLVALGHTPKEAVEENRELKACHLGGCYDSVIYCSVCDEEISRENKLILQSVHNVIDGTCTVCGSLQSSDGLVYVLNDDEQSYTVTDVGSFTGSNLVIDTYKNLPVTSIGASAFSGCYSLTNVTLGNSVISIGNYAFDSCFFLASVILSDSLTSIGEGAFCDCTNLTSIAIPKSVKKIGESAFLRCRGLIQVENGVSYVDRWVISCDKSTTSVILRKNAVGIADYAFTACDELTSIAVDEDNTKYHSEGNCIIETESKTLVVGCQNSVIPSDGSVTSIGKNAFYSLSTLESITIPNTVTSIGKFAFHYCDNLVSITFPSSLVEIGDSSFSGCGALTNITIPSSVTYIGIKAFSNCDSLTSISVETGNPKYHSAGNCIIETKSKTLVTGCKNSVIPSDGSVTSIGDCAFFMCFELESVTIPNTVTSIGENAFFACLSITNIVLPSSVISVGDVAFALCASLDNATIGQNVTLIGTNAFSNCWNLSGVTFENTSGWSVVSESVTSLSSTDLQSKSKAATYLTDTYSDSYIWRRN